MTNKVFRRVLPILLAIAMLFGISIVAIAAGGGGNAGLQANMAGTGFQIRLSDPEITMTNDGGTYELDNKYDSTKDIVFTFSLNPNGGQKGFGIYPAINEDPAGFDGVNIYEKSDPNKVPVLSLGGNYSEDTMNPDFFFEESYDASYSDHYVFNMATESTFSNERSSKLIIKANALKPGKTYCLHFPSTIKTYNNGSAKQLGSDVTIEFETNVDPEAPSLQAATANKKVPPGGITCNSNFGDATVDHPWEQDEIGLEVRVNPSGFFAQEYAEENYKQFSVTSYYGEEVPITVGPGRDNKNYSFYKINMTLLEPGWYCLTVGKNFKNDAGKTLGDYTGGEDWTYWILKGNTREQNGSQFGNPTVNLTTNLQNISYEDVSSYNSDTDYGDIAMRSLASDYPDPGYIVKLTATEGYALPSEISVTVNGKELIAGKDYEYTPNSLQSATVVKDSRNGTVEKGETEYNLIIDRHTFNGPVVITAAAVKPVSGVSLDKTELTLDEGDSATLSATVSPENASNKNVTWASSDEKVATVDETGKVTAAKAGTATITSTTEDGEKAATCAVTVNHVKEVLPAVEPTCTESGKTEGEKCKYCGEILEEQKDIPALGHKKADPVKEKEVAATCTKEGSYDEVVYCSECKTELSREAKTIDKLPHTEEVVKGKTATCTEKGLTDGKKCSVCGEILEEQKEMAALGHDYKDGACTRCDAKDPNYVKPDEPTTKQQEEPVATEGRIVKKNPSDGKWYLYNNGSVEWRYTGIAPNQYGWWRIKNGKVDFNATGVFRNEYGWWRVENGKVNFKAQGIYKNAYGWWKTTDGKVTFDETGIFKNEYGWWRVEDSKVNFKANSIYKNQYGWWKTTDGKVTFKENGLYKNRYGTWKVENSKVNFNYNGTYQGKTIKNGKVQ